MELTANAKLNLFLNIERKLSNGYHNLETIITPIDLSDTINVTPIKDNSIRICTNNHLVPTDSKNILFKCAKLMKLEFGISDGIDIYLNKQIPLSAGLGGESADAAALMRFYNQYYNLKISFDDIFRLGRMLSWDVPICYMNKCVHISDDRKICNYIDIKSHYYVLLVKPAFGILTKDAFSRIDEKGQHLSKSSNKILEGLNYGLPLTDGLFNCFIYADNSLTMEYKRIIKYAKSMGFDSASMSGTGSCFFFVTSNLDIANKGFVQLSKKYNYVKVSQII